MKKTLSVTLALLISLSAYLHGNSGLIMLGFAGAFEGVPLPLDSILVQNLTKGWDTMLYAPDNYIILDTITGVHEDHLTSEKGFQVRQNIPNPFQQNIQSVFCCRSMDTWRWSSETPPGRRLSGRGRFMKRVTTCLPSLQAMKGFISLRQHSTG